MSIKDKYLVKSISKHLTSEWCLKKHYAHRMPMAVEYPFGIFDNNNILKGISIFGPTAPPVPLSLFGEHGKYKVRELTRLIVNDNLGKNVLSFFLSECFKKLPKPMCLISFADSSNGHHGYIYQATNWIYTGEGGEAFSFKDINGKSLHSLTINDNAKIENLNQSDYLKKHKITKSKSEPKFRYLYFIGSKTQKRKMRKDLKLQILKYPKGKNTRYDASYEPTIQTELF